MQRLRFCFGCISQARPFLSAARPTLKSRRPLGKPVALSQEGPGKDAVVAKAIPLISKALPRCGRRNIQFITQPVLFVAPLGHHSHIGLDDIRCAALGEIVPGHRQKGDRSSPDSAAAVYDGHPRTRQMANIRSRGADNTSWTALGSSPTRAPSDADTPGRGKGLRAA